ncbi:hypothetical protein BDP81DRAFT_186088 [Colletotrichum phormii]|uniref:Uncharacterized protein n=1 Tax=Colletotrichum phormii TaxID=359342 RepID=A0AAI9ZXF5_9PEZI|nr:uncharacterized protein BDP81DRAFT_186088 [Colletotrichum phormii]KAK1639961.1 hypothetical protein BDP81DRAFT_186088 [Colletotrichum phormii]
MSGLLHHWPELSRIADNVARSSIAPCSHPAPWPLEFGPPITTPLSFSHLITSTASNFLHLSLFLGDNLLGSAYHDSQPCAAISTPLACRHCRSLLRFPRHPASAPSVTTAIVGQHLLESQR